MLLRESLIELFRRELQRLKDEVNLYEHEADLWICGGSINNSAGNLCLHLLGNLNHFIGAVLGNSGYVRQRDNEFALKNIPKQELLAQIEQAITIVTTTLSQLDDDVFSQIYPLEKHGKDVTTTQMLLHLLSHFNYHLGQINYHYRLLVSPAPF